MRDLLRGTLRQSLRAMTPIDRLAAAWPVACGRAMADHGQVTGLAEGLVQIQVTDPVWLDQMRTMRSILQNDLARISGVPLTGIHFHLKHSPAIGDHTHHE